MTHDVGPDPATERLLAERLLAEPAIAEALHVAGAAFIYALLRGTLPQWMLVTWMGAIVAATGARLFIRSRASRRKPPPETVPLAVRASIVAVGLTWGIGAFVLPGHLTPTNLSLVMVVLCGLGAGGTATLVADAPSYYGFLTAMLAPLALGLAFTGPAGGQPMAAVVVGLFWVSMVMVYRRAHLALLQQLELVRGLASSREAALREQGFLDELVASAPSAIAVLDSEWRVTRVNPAFSRLFGYSAQEAVGSDIDKLVVPPGELPGARALQTRVAEGGTVNLEGLRHRKDGTIIPVRVSAARVGGSQGGALALYEDVTVEVAARDALRAARDAAEQATAAKSAFLANMSHEIRTPMNGILGMTEILLNSELTPEQRRAADLIGTSGEALLAIINDVLDFSKIEAGQLDLEAIEFNLPALIDSSVRLLTPKAHERQVELICDVRPEVPSRILGDPTRLRQVLSNLVGNAVKFTHKGEIVVTASLQSAADGRARVRFAIADTGIGIAPDKVAQIMEPFGQADASTTRRYGGTGLGLSISRRLVQMMGGELDIETVVGQGSTFAFTIDAAVVEPAETMSRPRVEIRGVRMLIVDDNPTNRRILREMLEWGGCTAEEVDDPRRALVVLRDAAQAGTPYQLVLSDVHMPNMDGFTLTRAIRGDPVLRDTRIMLVSSGGRRGDGALCRELGIGAYLMKPVSRLELMDGIAATLNNLGTAGRRSLVTRHSIREARQALRVLVAEDNLVNQEVAAALLRKRGHLVDIVDNGRAAVEAVKAREYDIVLMDLQMPEMDGLEATRQIRAYLAGRPLPIVAVTANVMSGERERCREAGMDDYLAKPYKPESLFLLVDGWSAGDDPGPAKADVASESPVDLDGFREELAAAGVADVFDEILNVFCREAPGRLSAVEDAVAARDATRIDRAAHAFKSASGTIRAKVLAEQLAGLERAGRSGDLSEADHMLAQIRVQYESTMRHLTDRGGPSTDG